MDGNQALRRLSDRDLPRQARPRADTVGLDIHTDWRPALISAKAAGVGYILVHKDQLMPAALATVDTVLTRLRVTKIADDDQAALYWL